MKNFSIAALLTLITGCASNDLEKPFDCSTVTIAVTLDAFTNVSSCAASDGSLTVSATGGSEPYLFSINGGDFISSAVFQNLSTGNFTIQAKDANGCIGTLLPSPSLTSPGSTLTASASTGIDNSCLTDNGSISVLASGGVPPYTYRLGTGSLVSTADFANLASGNYSVAIRDAEGCTFTLNTSVSRGDTGVSWSAEVQSIITTNCAVSGCHNGSQSPNLSTLSGVQTNQQNVKSRTANKSMPPSGRTALSDEQIKKIGCWVDDGAKNN